MLFLFLQMFFFQRFFKKNKPPLAMKKFLIVGLGNIGVEYETTRHNIGFQVIHAMAALFDLPLESQKLAFRALLKHKGRQFVLIQPTTYMNLSGKAVRYWALKENIPLENILIITDELHLPFGTLRLKQKGSDGGHNGLKDIQAQLNTPNYCRLRFGIGQEEKQGDQVRFVLDEWNEEEKAQLKERIQKCCEIILSFGLQGVQPTMNAFNGK